MIRKPFTAMIRTRLRSGWKRLVLRFVVMLFACLLAAPSALNAQELFTSSPNKVKAAFIRNFAHYVTWPKAAFPKENTPWRIGILGDDPFGDVLEKTLRGRTEQQRPFSIFRADSIEGLPHCHIIFVAIDNPAKRLAVLAKLRQLPVLTVSDDPDFLRDGGIIRFRVEETLQIDINLDQAQAVSLNVQTKMLEIAGSVLEKGKVRKLR